MRTTTGRRANSYRANNRQAARVIVTALAERDEQLLLVQLAQGRFAGFWLLPSASVDEGTAVEAARRMMPERTGYPVTAQRLVSVIEEPRAGVLALRFVFAVELGEVAGAHDDRDIARACWFSRDAAREVLAERDVVPTLGVMSLIRAWTEGTELQPLELLTEEARCPCGSGFGYRGCCGWDNK